MRDTRQGWAHTFVSTTVLAHKSAPPVVPDRWGGDSIDVPTPGRPPELTVVERSPRSPSAGGLKRPEERARILHTFWHHELQAAELMCWAALRFPDTPEAFRDGLIAIALDEVRHMGVYRRHIEALGFELGDFGVRDWFWQRVGQVSSPVQFVALLGMGFEGANLDHADRWAQRFRAAGDVEGAAIQEQVGREEVGHVRFALKWFAEWTGGTDFDTWEASLPPPLTPLVLKGRSLQRAQRRRAGFSDDFLDALERWQPPGS